MAYADWYRVSATNFACNDHPGPPKATVNAVAEYTMMPVGLARLVLDRLKHLHWCCDEPDAITLLRLQQGKNQQVVDRSPATDDGEVDTGGVAEDDDD